MAAKNVTVLVAVAEHNSQELADLYRKTANLDVKTVLEGGHNSQGQRLSSYRCIRCKAHICSYLLNSFTNYKEMLTFF